MCLLQFIKPVDKDIELGVYQQQPMKALDIDLLNRWLGFAFDRYCRKNHHLIAERLGFSGIKYKSGVFFNRASQSNMPGYQIDLVFDRADKVYTICEIKYLQKPIGTAVIEQMERKLELFPNPKGRTIQRVLISAEGAEQALINRFYFDSILTLEDLLS